MKIEDFIAGKSIKCYQYACFVPSLINHEWTWDSQELTCSLEKAAKALTSLDTCPGGGRRRA